MRITDEQFNELMRLKITNIKKFNKKLRELFDVVAVPRMTYVYFNGYQYIGDSQNYALSTLLENLGTEIESGKRVGLEAQNSVNYSFIVIDNKTDKEADIGAIVQNEDWVKDLMYCDMEGFAINQDGYLILLDECGNFVYCPHDRFTIRFETKVK